MCFESLYAVKLFFRFWIKNLKFVTDLLLMFGNDILGSFRISSFQYSIIFVKSNLFDNSTQLCLFLNENPAHWLKLSLLFISTA